MQMLLEKAASPFRWQYTLPKVEGGAAPPPPPPAWARTIRSSFEGIFSTAKPSSVRDWYTALVPAARTSRPPCPGCVSAPPECDFRTPFGRWRS